VRRCPSEADISKETISREKGQGTYSSRGEKTIFKTRKSGHIRLGGKKFLLSHGRELEGHARQRRGYDYTQRKEQSTLGEMHRGMNRAGVTNLRSLPVQRQSASRGGRSEVAVSKLDGGLKGRLKKANGGLRNDIKEYKESVRKDYK